MALFSGNIEDLRSLYTTQLRYLLSTEQQIIKALPKMSEAATDPQLKQALQSHLQETEVHEQRLEQILSELAGEVDEKKCAVTAALIAAGEGVIKDTEDDQLAMPASLHPRRRSSTLRWRRMVRFATGRRFWATSSTPRFSTRHCRKKVTLTSC